jgi:hypothetical protein
MLLTITTSPVALDPGKSNPTTIKPRKLSERIDLGMTE